MTWLATTPGPDLPVPEGLARLRPPVVGTGSVTIADTGEPLVAVGPALPTLPVYASMPLEHRPREQRLRASVLQALIPADIALPDPWRLCLIDCWRPVAFQEALLEHYGAVMGDTAEFVARTDGPVPPPHTTGGAVDLTLAFDGVPLSLGTDFDA
ncbi:MAG TPA: hypothetical protein PKB06_04430, partial [Actinotalea sp.]|nr:hypothetical protein [Actinotalea sp.]